MNKEQIKKALDFFENDKFIDAKEILSSEIENRKNEFLKNKLELKEDINEAAKTYKLEKDAKGRALKSLQAIIDATKDKKDDSSQEIFKQASGIMKTFEKNKGFSKDQAKWIYDTSMAMFNR